MTFDNRLILKGALAGIVAGIMMAMYAMIASATFLNQGFFTPLYGIASPIVGNNDMMHSMMEGFYFTLGPALIGLMMHMAWSAIYGVIFGLVARALNLSGIAAVLSGLIYGLIIAGFMTWVVLPLVGQGAMPGMIGGFSFTVEHLIFGMVLGLWSALRPQDFTGRNPLGTLGHRVTN
jgi:uncharacterized membrane protein YagU involved in acid resistance